MANPLRVNAAELLRRPGSEKRLVEVLVHADAPTSGLESTTRRCTATTGSHIQLRLESLTDGIVVARHGHRAVARHLPALRRPPRPARCVSEVARAVPAGRHRSRRVRASAISSTWRPMVREISCSTRRRRRCAGTTAPACAPSAASTATSRRAPARVRSPTRLGRTRRSSRAAGRLTAADVERRWSNAAAGR